MDSKLLFIACLFGIGTTACWQDTDPIEISIVDEALVPHFEAFKTEARARGIEITASFDEIQAQIDAIDEQHVVGQCWYGGHGDNEVLIDSEFWQNASHLSREFVVFHELGHCYLDRDHSEATSSSGTCLSIMASGTGDCQTRYGQSTRDWYLDELFFGR